MSVIAFLTCSNGFPWWLGYILVRMFFPEQKVGNVLVSIGYGYFIGLFVVFLALVATASYSFPIAYFLGAFLILNLSLTIYGYKYVIQSVDWKKRGVFEGASVTDGGLKKIVLVAIILWFGLRLFSLGFEVIMQPLFPWDAYTAWIPKAHLWYQNQQIVPLVNYWDWAGNLELSKDIYVHDSAGERGFISYVTYWMALVLGVWDEGLIFLPWLIAIMAFIIGFTGQSMLHEVSLKLILFAVAGLLSLPIVNSHIALPGYVDLWLSIFVGLGVASVYQWCIYKQPRQIILAFLMVSGAYLVKSQSGTIWSALMICTLAISAINLSRTTILLVLFGVGAVIISVGYIGFEYDNAASVHHFVINKQLLKIPYLFNAHLPELDKITEKLLVVMRHLFIYSNWHMLWVFMLAIVLINPVSFLKKMPPPILFFQLASLSIIFIYVILVDYISVSIDAVINRAFLHVIPAYIVILLHSSVADVRPSAC